jgi:hypothetical protein
MSNVSAKSSYIWWDDDVRFVPDQHGAYLDLYSGSSWKQSADRHFAPFGIGNRIIGYFRFDFKIIRFPFPSRYIFMYVLILCDIPIAWNGALKGE